MSGNTDACAYRHAERSVFYRELYLALATAAQMGEDCDVLAFDLDYLAHFNQAVGHRYGDDLLVRVAQTVGELVTPEQHFSHLWGGTFALLARHEVPVADLAAQILTRIAAIPVPLYRILHSDPAGQLRYIPKAAVTASLVVMDYPTQLTTVDDFRRVVHPALQQAKGSGRNTWTRFTPASSA